MSTNSPTPHDSPREPQHEAQREAQRRGSAATEKPRPHAVQLCPPPRLAPLVVLAAIGAAIVGVMGAFLHDSSFDLAVTQAANSALTGGWRDAFDAIYATLQGRNLPFIVLGIVAGIMLLSRRIIRPAIAALTIGSTWVLVFIPKALVGRPRPDWDHLAHPPATLPSDMSFPSGHTTFTTVTVVVIFILIHRGLDASSPRSQRGPVAYVAAGILGAGSIAIIVATVLTRGVHFSTDAAGAMIFSVTLTPLVWALWEHLAYRLLGGGHTPHPGKSAVA